MIIEKYCGNRMSTRLITARTIVRERKLKRLRKTQKSKQNDRTS